jgi:small subunit ribosomal protein S6
MKDYEAIFIFDSKLTSDQYKAALQTVQDTIQKEGGQVAQTQEWGKKRLAYPIKSQYEAAYVLIDFKGDPIKNDRLRTLFKLNEHLLRCVIFSKEEYSKPNPRERHDHHSDSSTDEPSYRKERAVEA